jgi:hypothetical protein
VLFLDAVECVSGDDAIDVSKARTVGFIRLDRAELPVKRGLRIL